MRKLRAGIVGCGGIANGKHLPAMQKSGLYEVVAFCDIIIERAQETKEKFGTEDAKVFEDYRELLKEDLDVVYVTTPNRSHAEISIEMSCVRSQWQKIMQKHRRWSKLLKEHTEFST